MRTATKYESIAAVLALVGAVALVAVYYPVLNGDYPLTPRKSFLEMS
jgi:hypothetical protein